MVNVAQLVRALACEARGRGFNSRHSPHEKRAPVAQLDRVPDFESGGWGFEPLQARSLCSASSMVEHRPFKPVVGGSSPPRGTFPLAAAMLQNLRPSSFAKKMYSAERFPKRWLNDAPMPWPAWLCVINRIGCALDIAA
jgi:hypothetical protein